MRPRLMRYAAVGLGATASHYLLLVTAVELARWPAWLAAGAGAVLGAQVAYAGNRVCTFAHHGPIVSSWWRFQLTAVLGALASMALVAVATRAGVHYLAGQIVATFVVMLATYAVNARWAFGATRRRA